MKTESQLVVESLIGLTRDVARDVIIGLAGGAEETSSEIRFIYRGWKFVVSFDNGFVEGVGAIRVGRPQKKYSRGNRVSIPFSDGDEIREIVSSGKWSTDVGEWEYKVRGFSSAFFESEISGLA